MVGTHGAVEPYVEVSAHALEHVSRALVMENLYKLVGVALDIPEVREENAPVPAEAADERRQVVGHQREIALAKSHPAVGARHQGQGPLKGLGRTHDARDPAHFTDRRVVGVKADPY